MKFTATLLEEILAGLTRVFHSEADFQHALAWELQQQCPPLEIRHEYKINGITVDFWVVNDDERVAVELKYPKQPFIGKGNGERFKFGDDATDVAAHGFLADVERLERLVNRGMCDRGIVLILTNNSVLWSGKLNDSNYDAFKIFEGRTLRGRREWAPESSLAEKHGPVDLAEEYTIEWLPYSYDYPMQVSGNEEFRYSCVEVKSDQGFSDPFLIS